MKNTKATLIADHRVQRLLKNPNWKPAAEAAMDYIFNGTEIDADPADCFAGAAQATAFPGEDTLLYCLPPAH